MHLVNSDAGLPKAAQYHGLQRQLAALMAGERNGLANAANMAALLYQGLPDLNWVGFYFLHGRELVLGPFQGKVACVRIPLGRGVCGTAAERRDTVIVPDVHAYPGHIACDAASRSEIVVPMLQNGRLLGVLDLDSPQLARFDQDDAAGLNAAVGLLLQCSELGRFID
ncbi:MAG TPA: GAF domain-containing protein [Steroidobacteraceae bacterium]|nr:GAF domain-containing protein [Steroidobacteraceae bacterium]